ncbi:ankyrin repeat domain-containing protein [Corynebacterium sp. SY003]|uniref:ankyrin repeat domain-containing protein n=1 Tax=unclassified Corynebacterium TaxID=2624378 RepID=UPI00351ADC83
MHSEEELEQVAEFASRLFDLARSNDPQASIDLAAYIDQGVDVDLMNHEGNTFAMLAAYCGNAQTLRALIARGADVNKLNDRGQSPLAGAIFKKEMEIISILLAAGADPYAGHPSAVDTARMFGMDDLFTFLE